MKKKKVLLVIGIPLFIFIAYVCIFLSLYVSEDYYEDKVVLDKLVGNTYLFRSQDSPQNIYDSEGYLTKYSDLYIKFCEDGILKTSDNGTFRYKIAGNKIVGSRFEIYNMELFGKKYDKLEMHLRLEPSQNELEIYGEIFVSLQIYDGSKQVAYTYPDFNFGLLDLSEDIEFEKTSSTTPNDFKVNPLSEKMGNIQLKTNGNCSFTLLGANKSGTYSIVTAGESDDISQIIRYIIIRFDDDKRVLLTLYSYSGSWTYQNATLHLEMYN